MEAKEAKWLKEKIGVFSASEIHLLTSKSGKFTDGNKTYLYKIERQRYLNQPAPPVHSRNMEAGIVNEVYVIAWLRENFSRTIRHCDVDYDDKIFIKTDWGLGCSPDAYEVEVYEIRNEQGAVVHTSDEIVALVETKVVTGEETINFYFSPTIPFERKRLRAFDEHRDQMASQLLAHPKIGHIKLVKYDYQNDDDPFDLRPVLDKTRGIIFEFTRAEFGSYLDDIRERVMFADQYLKDKLDIELVDKAWSDFQKEKQNTVKTEKENGTENS